jgi:hypothetical protein
MKRITAIVLVIISSAFILHKSMLIKPGEFIGPFETGKTTFKEVKEKLGEGKMETFIAPNCGMHYHHLNYKKEGIRFKTSSDKVKNSDTIYLIEINEKCDAATAEGIRAGKSTRADVIKVYGRPDDNMFEIHYEQLGIGFQFGDAGDVYKETDKVTEIFIHPKGN